MGIVNQNGREPTALEIETIRARAVKIFQNPYASPEQMGWAMEVYPEGFALDFDIRPKPWEVQP